MNVVVTRTPGYEALRCRGGELPGGAWPGPLERRAGGPFIIGGRQMHAGPSAWAWWTACLTTVHAQVEAHRTSDLDERWKGDLARGACGGRAPRPRVHVPAVGAADPAHGFTRPLPPCGPPFITFACSPCTRPVASLSVITSFPGPPEVNPSATTDSLDSPLHRGCPMKDHDELLPAHPVGTA